MNISGQIIGMKDGEPDKRMKFVYRVYIGLWSESQVHLVMPMQRSESRSGTWMTRAITSGISEMALGWISTLTQTILMLLLQDRLPTDIHKISQQERLLFQIKLAKCYFLQMGLQYGT